MFLDEKERLDGFILECDKALICLVPLFRELDSKFNLKPSLPPLSKTRISEFKQQKEERLKRQEIQRSVTRQTFDSVPAHRGLNMDLADVARKIGFPFSAKSQSLSGP
jgi:hypothetical protein